MHEIKNLTNAPYDLETVDGIKRLPALGTVTAKFEPEYLTALRECEMYAVREVKAAGRSKKD